MIYLDYAASTPVDKEVLDIYYETSIKYYANPNSNHAMGINAKKEIDNATIKIAELLNVKCDEIIYTSGATEANNLVIFGIAERYKNYGKHIIISSMEHSSITTPATILQERGYTVDILKVNKDGLIDIDELKKMIRSDTILVSITSVDSEIGIVEPIEEIGKILKDYPNTYFHTDSSASIGKVDINYENVDLVTINPHKFYGMNDIGILIKKKNVMLTPIIYGGRSTTVFRSGTPNTAGIVSTAKALELATTKQEERYEYIKKLNGKIINFLSTYKNIHINNTVNSLPYTINFSIQKTLSKDVVEYLNKHEIYVSSKTSCCPVNTPSKLVYALTKDKNLSLTSIRLSLSHKTTEKELDEFFKVFKKYMKEIEENGEV